MTGRRTASSPPYILLPTLEIPQTIAQLSYRHTITKMAAIIVPRTKMIGAMQIVELVPIHSFTPILYTYLESNPAIRLLALHPGENGDTITVELY